MSIPTLVLLCASALSVAACTAAPGVAGPGTTTSGPGPAPVTSATANPVVRLPVGSEPVTLDPRRFTAEITHPYWPMPVGRRWTYRETAADGTVTQVVVVVTSATKRIANGITARVVRDTVTEDGVLIEDTFDWYAQDDVGNVWYLGEDTAEFEDGRIASREGSFEAGVDGALPGILLPAEPSPGMRYRQEYYRGKAEDNGEVLSTAETVQVPTGIHRNALLTKDTVTIEPDVQEYKLYARGVGPVLALGISGGAEREELVTVDTAPPAGGTGPLGTPGS